MSHPPLQTSHRGVFREQGLLKLCESRDAERNVRNGWKTDIGALTRSAGLTKITPRLKLIFVIERSQGNGSLTRKAFPIARRSMSQKIRFLAMGALTVTLLICIKYGQQADWMAVGVLSALKLLLIVLLVVMVFLEVLRSPGEN